MILSRWQVSAPHMLINCQNGNWQLASPKHRLHLQKPAWNELDDTGVHEVPSRQKYQEPAASIPALRNFLSRALRTQPITAMIVLGLGPVRFLYDKKLIPPLEINPSKELLINTRRKAPCVPRQHVERGDRPAWLSRRRAASPGLLRHRLGYCL